MDLEEKYKEETGFDVGKIHDIGTTYYSIDYVEWLEKQLLPVVSVALLCDVEKGTKCKDPFPKYRTGVCRNCGGQSN